MSREEIQKTLETAYHEVGHAFAYVGQGLYVSAQAALSEANKAIHLAHDALDEIQD